jgi:hypothetical protein
LHCHRCGLVSVRKRKQSLSTDRLEKIVSGVGTNVFNWGNPAPGSFISRLRFDGASFADIPLAEFFVVGDLTYRNGTTFLGTEPDSVDLLASLVFAAPTEIPQQNLTFGFEILTTLNVGDQEADADTIPLTSLFPSSKFTLDGSNTRSKPASDQWKTVASSSRSRSLFLKNRRASVELIGRITAAKACTHSRPDDPRNRRLERPQAVFDCQGVI